MTRFAKRPRLRSIRAPSRRPPCTPPPRSSAMSNVSKGSIYRRPETRTWNIKFYVDGRRYRESTETDDRELALAYLARRLEEVRTGRFVEQAQRITFEEMHQLLLENYGF